MSIDLSHISLIMIAGNQNNIGMAVLLRHEKHEYHAGLIKTAV